MNPKQIEEFFHLSPIQKCLMLSCERSHSPELFLSQFSCTIAGNLDVSAFKRAWNKLSDRHPALRLTFVSADVKEPVQVINRSISTIFEEHDWRQFSPNEQAQKFAEIRQADIRMDYQLKTAPLWWITLARLNEQRYHFIWTYHQILFDQTSIAILWEELLLCYNAIRQGKNPELPPSPPFRNYIDWVKTLDVGKAEEFWRQQLQGIPAVTKALPIDYQTTLMIPSQLIQRVSEVHAGLDAVTILLGAWSLLLSRFSQAPQVLFGLKTNARPNEIPDSQRMIGYFDNSLPLVVGTNLKLSTGDWLRKLQSDISELNTYRSFSSHQICQWNEVSHEKPLFASEVRIIECNTLTKISDEQLDLKINELNLTEPGSETQLLEFQLVENQPDSQHPLTFSLESLLQSFATSPQKPINELLAPPKTIPNPVAQPINVGEPDAEAGWVNWIRASLNVTQRLSEQVRENPGMIAVGDGKNSFTFQELNRQVEKLAGQLIQLGVTTTVPVGVCSNSPLLTAVSMLGILKAGGAYVPLAQPPSSSTLRKILKQTSLPIILTQANLEDKVCDAISNAYNTPGPALPFPMIFCPDLNAATASPLPSNTFPEVSDDHPAAIIYADAEEFSTELISQFKLAKLLDDPLKWFLPVINSAWKLIPNHDFSDPQLDIEEDLPEIKIEARQPEPVIPLPELLEEVLFPPTDIADLSELIDEEEIEVEESAPVILDEQITNAALKPEDDLTDFVIIDESKPTQSALAITPTMLPAHNWFLDQNYENLHYGNHAWLVEVNETLQPELLRKALLRLIEEQEILRMKFIKTDDEWKPKFVERLPELPLEIIDLSSKWASSQRKALEDSAARIQAGLHLSYSSLFHVAYFERGAERVDRMLIVLHRMISDDDSRQIFLDRLMTHYEAVATNKVLSNNDKPISIKRQLDRLRSILTPEFITSELQYWKKIRENSFPKFGKQSEESLDTYASVDKVFINLSPVETQFLLDSVAGNEMNEMVLAALTLAVAKWTNQTQVFIEVETSIRQNQLMRLDLSNTISPATTRYPVKFEIEKSDDPILQMENIREQFRAVPHAGFGFELLKYFADEQTRILMKKIPRPQIAYQFIEISNQSTKWKTAPEAIGSEFDLNNHFSPGIAVSGNINRGMLDFHLSYSRALYQQTHIGELANYFIEELRAIISSATSSTRAH